MKYVFSKRVLDVVGASAGLLSLLPFLPFIVFAIRAESRGSALIRLERISGGKTIKVFKFRTMIEGAHAMKSSLARFNERSDGPFFKIAHDPRVTRVGRILRRFRIDEFPQLINVLTGDLALVGPRPHEPEEVENYPREYRHIALAKAGVTGYSQVNGASSLPFLKELEYDSNYLEMQSLALDLKIIGKTCAIIFTDPTAV